VKTIFLVKPEEADKAREIETKLLSLPHISGILFVGVAVKPTEPGKSPLYRIWVGCVRELEEDLLVTLVHHTLREDIEKGLCISVEAHRGVSRMSQIVFDSTT